MSKKPILDGFELRAKPVSSPSAAKTTKWTFSFIDFSQVELFGLNKSSNNWFSALLSQLKKVSTIDIDRLNKDKTLQSDLRYHRIEWGAERIPVNRNYFNWIDSNVLKNEEEFPFFQFQITTGLGRVVGYWYEDIFHIIAFDPLHNLQPSKKHNYQIRPCSPVESDLTTLLYALEKVKRYKCSVADCKVQKGLDALHNPLADTNVLLMFLEDDYIKQLDKILQNKSLSEMMEIFLLENN